MLAHSWLNTFFACLLCFFTLQTTKANPVSPIKEISFEHISVDKGLSSTIIYAITQTDDGFLWIGTQNGLNRYDGYGFKLFTYIPGDKKALSNNWIKSFCKDKKGNLWVGTSSGLNIYHAETETFTKYFNDTDLDNSLVDNNIWSLYTDKEGTVWVGTNNGLSRYNVSTNDFTNFLMPSTSATQINNAINCITEDTQGNLWVGTYGSGVFKLDKRTGIFKSFAQITSIQATARLQVKVLKFDSHGLLWIGSQGNGVHTYDLATKEYTTYTSDANNPNFINDNVIMSLMEDSRGDIWIGTYGNGINYFNRTTSTFQQYKTDFLKSQSLQGYWVTSFYEDKAGNIWVGHDNGLSKFNPQGPKFLHYKNIPFDSNSVPNSNISVIYQDKEGMVWIGTWGASITRFDKSKDRFTHYKHDPNNQQSLIDHRVWGLCEDAEGNIWIATSGGLDKFDKKKGIFEHFNELQKDNPAAQISFAALSFVAFDKQGRLWVTSWGGGLFMYDTRSNTTTHFKHNPYDYNSLSNDRIKHVFIDSKQNVWLSTSEGGLDRLSFDASGKANFKHFRHNGSKTQGIGSDSPQIVFEDSKHKIWVGAEGGGLSFYDPEKDDFQRIYIKRTSYFPNSVYGILEDDIGNFWLSTNNGIVHYNPVSANIKGYDVTDGLQGNTFHAGHCKTKDGAMLFGGHNGFNLFYPVAMKESSFRPPVLLSEIRIFNELIEVGKPHKNTFAGEHPILQKPLFLCDEISLSYRDYILSLSFTSLDFSAPHKNKFAYMLENFEDEWNYTDASKRFATYTNLKPGEYIFKVKGTNSDGIWNERPATLKLIITPPFWQTWWFRTVAISFFFLVAYAIHRMWVQVKLENLLALEKIKIQEAEAIRKKVAMDFHDEMGNQLASITAIINLINIRQSKKEFYIDDLLTRLNQHAQTLFYGTKDFIWSIDPKSDKVEVILMNIKDFGEDLFDRTGISFHFIKELHDTNFTFPAGASRHITLICKEVFTNIVKHASCKSVHVKAISEGDSLSISIKDNGCGFDIESLKRVGNGLENMRARAKKINAEISIHSMPNLGTEITVNILIPKKGDEKKKVVLDLAK